MVKARPPTISAPITTKMPVQLPPLLRRSGAGDDVRVADDETDAVTEGAGAVVVGGAAAVVVGGAAAVVEVEAAVQHSF